MHNFTLYLKSLFLATITTFITTFAVYATSSNSKEKSSFYLIIESPTENIKKIPILGYKLIYRISHSSLVDFLENPIDDFINNLTAAGIKPKNIVIIFTNYSGYKNNINDPSYPLYNKPTPSGLDKYKTQEGLTLNLTALTNKYSLPFLITKRYVLIGTLIDNNTIFMGNANLKVTNFDIPDATGFSFYKQPTAPENNNKKANEEHPLYSYEELISQRASMIQYMNLGIFKNTSFIGMMEYKDLTNNSYSYLAISGNLSQILYPNNNSKSILGEK